LRGASVAYLTAVITFVTLIITLGWFVSGQFPKAGAYWALWLYALIASGVVALFGGYLARNSWLGAIGIGVIGGLALLTITSAAAYGFGILWRAV
jgi:hypothetical protein